MGKLAISLVLALGVVGLPMSAIADPVTTVGYSLQDGSSKALFAQVNQNSTRLQSLKQAVLDSANTQREAGVNAPPPLGAKWTDPTTQTKYNVIWEFSGPAATTKTVSVTNIVQRQ
jgi:hypothetical protein